MNNNSCNAIQVAHGKHNVPHAFGMTLFDDSVYWTDWTELGVRRVDKFGGPSSLTYAWNKSEAVYPMGIVAFHEMRQLTRLTIAFSQI